ncbi:hypothetical protein EVAR_10604_1 [Eumeta japonica]|uniref:Uncharacterized protein n=1 Tax=Eumeta variegata TaxID=151549 RepID=A0A4C1U252_EUMVA|nr:hypothetical protein EVAR_10604_1 [Eumeta japonica]
MTTCAPRRGATSEMSMRYLCRFRPTPAQAAGNGKTPVISNIARRRLNVNISETRAVTFARQGLGFRAHSHTGADLAAVQKWADLTGETTGTPHTLTKCEREVVAFAVGFSPRTESAGGPLTPFNSSRPSSSDILFFPKRLATLCNFFVLARTDGRLKRDLSSELAPLRKTLEGSQEQFPVDGICIVPLVTSWYRVVNKYGSEVVHLCFLEDSDITDEEMETDEDDSDIRSEDFSDAFDEN